MSGWLRFLHCDLTLTRIRKTPFPVYLDSKVAHYLPAVITRECLDQKTSGLREESVCVCFGSDLTITVGTKREPAYPEDTPLTNSTNMLP